MPKGNQVPGLPVNEESARQFICQHVFETIDTATRTMSVEEAGKLAEALCEEIDHVSAAIEREQRWKKLVKLMGKNQITAVEAQTIIALLKRQGVELESMD